VHFRAQLFAASVGLAGLLAGCALTQLQAPAINPLSVELTDVQINEQRFTVRLDVQNPNDRPLPIKSASCTLEIQGVNVGRGESTQPFSVPAHGNTEVDMLVTTNLLNSVPELFGRVLQHGTMPDYRFSGWINPDIALLPPIPFSRSGQIAAQ
jgi:LEA14-like dessication related protein